MDSRCRARGLVKGMLGPPTAASSNASSCSSHFSFVVHHHEKAMMTPANHRVVVHEAMNVHEANLMNPYGVVVDEHIDRKAAIYISSVQERFRLEGLIN